MKKILVLCAVLMCGTAANAMDKIEIIRDIPNMPKDKIYTATKQWIAKNFVSAQDVIQFDDKETGSLILKGNVDYPCSNNWSCTHRGITNDVIDFTMKIDVKDQKIRITVDDVLFSTLNSFGKEIEKIPNKKQEVVFGKRLSGLSNSLILAVEGASEVKNDDW